nr:MAG TPA: hypothetical protein [Caudoviricetes sp.]
MKAALVNPLLSAISRRRMLASSMWHLSRCRSAIRTDW